MRVGRGRVGVREARRERSILEDAHGLAFLSVWSFYILLQAHILIIETESSVIRYVY